MSANDSGGTPKHLEPVKGQEFFLRKGLKFLGDGFPAKLCSVCQGAGEGEATPENPGLGFCRTCDGGGLTDKTGKVGPWSWRDQVVNAGKK